MDSGVQALAVLPNGDLVAGEGFLKAGDVTANSIARWNGGGPLDSGVGRAKNAAHPSPNHSPTID
jgi:hypothetical protein